MKPPTQHLALVRRAVEVGQPISMRSLLNGVAGQGLTSDEIRAAAEHLVQCGAIKFDVMMCLEIPDRSPQEQCPALKSLQQAVHALEQSDCEDEGCLRALKYADESLETLTRTLQELEQALSPEGPSGQGQAAQVRRGYLKGLRYAVDLLTRRS